MPFLDFDTLVICNNDHNAGSLNQTMKFFYDLGVKKFIITHGVDPAISSTNYILNTHKQVFADVCSAKLKGSDLLFSYNVHLSDGCLKNPFIKKLTFGNSNRIFIQAPLFINDWWLMSDLNYLIHSQHLFPVFVAAERNLISFDEQFFDRFFHTQNASFCIDINTITSLRYLSHIKHAVLNGVPIIPCISNDLHSYAGVIERFEILKERLGTQEYLKLCKHMSDSKRYVLSN